MSKPNDLQIDETTQEAYYDGARWYKRQSDELDDWEIFSLIVYRIVDDYSYQWAYLNDLVWNACPEIEPAPDWGRLVEPPQPLTDGTMAQPERVADTDKLKEAFAEGARWYKEFKGGEYQDIVFKRHGSFGVFYFAIIQTGRGLHWYLAPDNQPADDWQELVLPPPPPQPLTTDEKTVKIFNMIVDNGYALDESYFLPRIKEIIEA